MKFTDFEIQVLKIMLESEYSTYDIQSIVSTSVIVGFEFTGAGYFLKISNELFPIERKVIGKPIVTGENNDFQVGFILFLENKTLTIECHSWSEKNPPKGIRTMDLEIKIGL